MVDLSIENSQTYRNIINEVTTMKKTMMIARIMTTTMTVASSQADFSSNSVKYKYMFLTQIEVF